MNWLWEESTALLRKRLLFSDLRHIEVALGHFGPQDVILLSSLLNFLVIPS